jgi:hypothetical protein
MTIRNITPKSPKGDFAEYVFSLFAIFYRFFIILKISLL